MQTGIFGNTKSPRRDTHAHRGMEFEGWLEYTHAKYQDAVITHQHPPCLPTGKEGWGKIIGKSTVDYTGCVRGYFVAFDAKSTKRPSVPLDTLQDHQLEYLLRVEDCGGKSFVLVRFPGDVAFAIPAWAWDLSVQARRSGKPIERTGWTGTGKASINAAELPDRWRVPLTARGFDWVEVVMREVWG